MAEVGGIPFKAVWSTGWRCLVWPVGFGGIRTAEQPGPGTITGANAGVCDLTTARGKRDTREGQRGKEKIIMVQGHGNWGGIGLLEVAPTRVQLGQACAGRGSTTLISNHSLMR